MVKPIVVKITGDADDLDKTTRDVDGMFDRLSGTATRMAGVLGGAFVVGGAVAALGTLNGLATELDVLDTKTSTVFEGAADTVRAWADANNEAMGLSEQKLAGLAAGFGDLLKPMGFTAAQAATMATDVVGLSGALSAWSGGTKTAAEVSEVLAKAMLGEREGLKELGISISEADVTARLAANGTDKLTGAALQQAKAVATQQLIFEKSTDAQTAWADGSMDAIKNQNELRATVDDLKASLAQKLQPAFAAVARFAVDTLIPAFKDLAAAVQDFYERRIRPLVNFLGDHKEILIGVAAAIGVGLVAAFWSWAAAASAAAAATIAATWPVIAIGAAIGALVAGVIWAYKNWGWFKTAVDTVADALTNYILPAIKAVAGWLADKLAPVVRLVVDYYKWLFDIAMAVARAFVDHVLPVLQAVAGWLWDHLVPGVQAQIDAFQKLWDMAVPAFAAIRDAIGWVVDKLGLNREGFQQTWEAAQVAFGAIRDAVQWVVDKVAILVGVFQNLKAQISSAMSGLADAIVAPFRDAFDRVTSLWDKTVGRLPVPGGIDIPFIGGRAHGGPVTAGRPYLVGERGPEMVVPSQSGTVLTNQQTGQALGGGGTTIVVNSPIGRPDDVVAWLREQLRRSERARR